MPDNPDASDSRPNSKKEKQALRSEIASVFKEDFALRDERDRDFDKFESLIAGISVGGDNKKTVSHASGSIATSQGTSQYASSQLRALYEKMSAGRTWNSASPSQWLLSSTIGNPNPEVGSNKTVDLDNAISAKLCMIWATCGGDK